MEEWVDCRRGDGGVERGKQGLMDDEWDGLVDVGRVEWRVMKRWNR